MVILGALWSITATRFHLSDTAWYFAVTVILVASGGLTWLRLRARAPSLLGIALCATGVFAWYQTITPEQNKAWAVDVSRGVTAIVKANTVRLRNIRDFEWQTSNTATHRWFSGTYDLTRLKSVDVITSVWDNPDIAHLMVSFGFYDGENVVFSVETRREAHEAFNTVGGFFRQFELVLIAATERDILKLRTDIRQERVRMDPVALSHAQMKDLFLSYVRLAQDLSDAPSFYNTLTANCTTVVFNLANSLWPEMPLDWRVILSGHVPDYLDRLGVLEQTYDANDGRAANLLPDSSNLPITGLNYSELIRFGR
ncbi:DUF4105 domain-containing protein [Roseibium denhamense]|uniref:Lnb N-terminal periplasmic domain-containing protein n=1 Tax=Roseibium denhamense TaxID=76305 RepID=UPI0018AD133E|nr:DUF4105 domain-containing protein [Roseibium denhamense]